MGRASNRKRSRNNGRKYNNVYVSRSIVKYVATALVTTGLALGGIYYAFTSRNPEQPIANTRPAVTISANESAYSTNYFQWKYTIDQDKQHRSNILISCTNC